MEESSVDEALVKETAIYKLDTHWTTSRPICAHVTVIALMLTRGYIDCCMITYKRV